MQNYWNPIFNVNGDSLPGPLIIGTFEKRAPGPYTSRNFLIWTHFENAFRKNRTYACTFPVQRNEFNVVKVRFTMRYPPRKLWKKVITIACNFWRKNCLFLSGYEWKGFIVRQKIFEIPPFFQTRPGDVGEKVHACLLRFSALKLHYWKVRFTPYG